MSSCRVLVSCPRLVSSAVSSCRVIALVAGPRPRLVCGSCLRVVSSLPKLVTQVRIRACGSYQVDWILGHEPIQLRATFDLRQCELQGAVDPSCFLRYPRNHRSVHVRHDCGGPRAPAALRACLETWGPFLRYVVYRAAVFGLVGPGSVCVSSRHKPRKEVHRGVRVVFELPAETSPTHVAVDVKVADALLALRDLVATFVDRSVGATPTPAMLGMALELSQLFAEKAGRSRRTVLSDVSISGDSQISQALSGGHSGWRRRGRGRLCQGRRQYAECLERRRGSGGGG